MKKYLIIYLVLLLVIPVTISYIFLGNIDCSGGLCDGPGLGILLIELNLAVLVLFSIVYWLVIWRLRR